MVMLGWKWEGLEMLAEDVLFVRSQSEGFQRCLCFVDCQQVCGEGGTKQMVNEDESVV